MFDMNVAECSELGYKSITAGISRFFIRTLCMMSLRMFDICVIRKSDILANLFYVTCVDSSGHVVK